ncbi:MAG: flagellar biosynthetic protein FliR [Deltaproteobacteria bacterium]|nr:flagellar biosynthetic protein FliR [Deltaproteobacteria bacterium]
MMIDNTMEFMQLMGANPAAFIYALARTGGVVFSAPVFGDAHVPARIKAALAVVLALLTAPLMQGAAEPGAVSVLVSGVITEAVTGLIIGLGVRMIFVGVAYAGQVAAAGVSYGIGAMYDPAGRAPTAGVPEFFTVFAVLVFLSVNGHLMVIEALSRSFQFLPAGRASLTPGFMEHAVVISAQLFAVALKLAGPVLATGIFVNAACGLVARSAPGMDGLTISFAAAALAGLFVILLSLPSMEVAMRSVFDAGFDNVNMLIMDMRHAV